MAPVLGNLKTLAHSLLSQSFWLHLAWKICIFGFIYIVILLFFIDDALPPNGNLFHMFMLFIWANICGQLAFIFNLPPLFGMLVAGFIYGNVFQIELDAKMTSTTRSFALMVILLRAGLNLDPDAIKKLSLVCFRLAFLPCIIETVTIGLCAFLLMGLSISWSLMLGFVIAAVSPAVVVPGMIKTQENKLGVEKGIPTLIIAAASIDDVLAITGFSVCLGFAFSSSQNSESTWEVVKSVLKGPFEAAVGIGYGLLLGALCWYLPEICNLQNISKPKYDLHRFVFLLLAGVIALFGSQHYNLSGSGPLAVLVTAFIASLHWRLHQCHVFSERCLKILWSIFEHFLFCLIGADVRINQLQSGVLLNSFLCLLVGLALRTLTAYCSTFGTDFTHNERLFTAIAWIPKATVQAAIGPIALDQAVSENDVKNGRLVLTAAVLSILITAPLGAIAIDFFSKRLLNKKSTAEDICLTNIEDTNEQSSIPLSNEPKLS